MMQTVAGDRWRNRAVRHFLSRLVHHVGGNAPVGETRIAVQIMVVHME